MMDFFHALGFLFAFFCMALGVAFVSYAVFQTARNVKRQLLRGIVEERADIRRAAEVR